MTTSAPLDFRLLGPVEISTGERLLRVPAEKQRALLAYLLLHADVAVPPETLIDAFWYDPPRTALKVVRVYISQLRKLLAGAGAPDILVTEPAGYRLRLDRSRLDVYRFEQLALAGHAALGDDEVETARAALGDGLSLWRGRALADLRDAPFVAEERVRLEELRRGALYDRVEADLRLGRHEQLVPELEQLVARNPLDERFAARLLLALYRCGRQVDALAAFSAVRRRLDDLGIEPGSELRRLQQAILRHAPELDPPTGDGRSGDRTNLPAPPTSLLGREPELADISTLLQRGRLVTLTGPAGSGKTRLAVEVAAAAGRRYRDGVWFVPLATLRDPRQVPSAVAAALRIESGADEAAAELEESLRNRRLMLVLDNFEHLLDAAPRLGDWLASAPGLTLLVTSRAPLGLTGEFEYPVLPLAAERAVELFVERARAVNPGFVLTDENALPVAEVCRRLDGLPLSIELAATRTRLLPPSELLARLGSRLDLLHTGPRGAPERHRGLRATLAWSHQLLSPPASRVFARLGVFVGGCTLEAAEPICGRDGDDVLDSLEELVEHSLVQVAEGQPPRFSMLETMREYACELLAASPEEEAEAGRRHAEFFVALAERAVPEYAGPNQAAWHRRIELEHDNFRAALGWSLDGGDAAVGLRLATALARFWDVHGHYAEGLRWLSTALEITPAEPSRVRAHALLRRASLLNRQRRYAEARASAELCLKVARELGDAGTVRDAILRLGEILAGSGQHAAAEAVFSESVALARAAGDDGTVVAASIDTAYVALVDGNAARAREVLEDVEPLCRRLDNRRLTAILLSNLGFALLAAGERDMAAERLREGLAIAFDIGHRGEMAYCLIGLAAAAVGDGAYERAARLLGAVAALREAIGIALETIEEERYETTVERVASELGAESYTALLEEGRTWSLDAAVAEALGGGRISATYSSN